MMLSLLGFIQESYVTLILLFSILTVVLFTPRPKLQESRPALWIVLLVLVMVVATYVEAQSRHVPEGADLRYRATAIAFIIPPYLLFLELRIIAPDYVQNRVLLAVPALVNTALFLLNRPLDCIVYRLTASGLIVPGPLNLSPYITNAVYLVLLIVYSYLRFRHVNRPTLAIVILLVVLTLTTCAMELTGIVTSALDEVICIDILVYYMYLSMIHRGKVQQALDQEKMNVAESRIRLMQEQIQPHFLYNTLYIITILVKRDPNQAVEALESFTTYLRSNLNTLKSDRLIPFEKELTHIRAFMRLVEAEKPGMIGMSYDLGITDFWLPPLTVEPLVENAIRHGITLREGKGTVKLTTREEGGQIRITVEDDGVGVSYATRRQQNEKGIGLENVRTRLALQCDGTLEIDSDDTGTRATVRFAPPSPEPMSAGRRQTP